MSWLSELWRKLKRDRTDAEYLFEIYVNTLGSSAKLDLKERLVSVKYAVDLAGMASADSRIDEAQEWVDGAIAVLEP